MTQEKKKKKNPRARFGGFNTYGSRKAKSRKNEERLVQEKTKEKKSEKFSLLQREARYDKSKDPKPDPEQIAYTRNDWARSAW